MSHSGGPTRVLAVVLIVLALLSVAVAGTAAAADGTNATRTASVADTRTVTASSLEMTGGAVDAGESVTVTITFRNNGTVADEVGVQLAFAPPLDGAWEIVGFDAPDRGAWFESDRFFAAEDIEPDQVVNATFTVRPPPNTPPGEYTIEATGFVTSADSTRETSLEATVTVESFVRSIDPSRTYLHTVDDDAGPSERIALAEYGIEPGDRLRLTRLGSFEDGAAGTGLLAVFSTNATLLSPERRARVPGAIDAGRDHITSPTFFGDEPTDVPEDFLVADNAGERTSTTVTVPSGARYLFVAGKDNLYGDNADPDGDFGVRVTPVEDTDPFGLDFSEQPPERAGRRAVDLLEADELSVDNVSRRLGATDPARAGAVFDYLLENGEPIVAADLFEAMDERNASAVLEVNPELSTVLTDPEFLLLSQIISKYDLDRLVNEEETGELFSESDPDVSFANVSEFPDLTPRERNVSLEDARTLSSVPGAGFDAKVRWKKPGATGFGMYQALDVASNGGDILAIAGSGATGGLWRKEAWTFGNGWDRVGHTLDAPYEVIDAAVDPTDPDHLYAIIPETKETFGLYESTDDGRTWRRDDDFTYTLKDDRQDWKEFRRGARVEFLDNGNVFVYNYENVTNGTTRETFSLHLQGKESVERSLDLSGETGVTISYWERGYSFDGSATARSENAKLEFYDGEQWHTLNASTENSFGWRKRTYRLPDDWVTTNEDARIRFVFENSYQYGGCCKGDHWFVDDITVSSDDGTVFREDWEDGDLEGWSADGLPVVVDEDHWVYYSRNGGSTWNAGSISISDPNRPGEDVKVGGHFARNRLSMTENGNGVLNPIRHTLFVTRDYGRTWQKLKNYTTPEVGAVTHTVAADGTVHVAYDDDNVTYLDTYAPGSTSANTRTISNSNTVPGRVTSDPDGYKYCVNCPQQLTVVTSDSSHLVLFLYGSGPYQSRDGGNSWDKLYNNPKTVHSPAIQPKRLRVNDPPEDALATPSDFRDVQMMEEVGEDEKLLVGADQGLYVWDLPSSDGDPLNILNIVGSLDHTQMRDVKVDDCGNLYHGMWHASAMVRTRGDPKNIKQQWETRRQYQKADLIRNLLHLEAQPFYWGGGESNYMFLKDRSDCLGWATKGSTLNSPPKFGNFLSDDFGALRKKPISGPEVKNVSGSPEFFDGKWHYKESNSSALVSRTLSASDRTVEVRNVRWLQKDNYPAGSADDALWVLNSSKKRLQRFDGASQSSSLTTAVDFRGSDLEIEDVDVNDGRVAMKVEDTGSGTEDVVVYDTASASEPIDESDVSVSNPFDGANVLQVFVDPTNDARYFVAVRDTDDPQCPHHLMVSEDRGSSWQVFSQEVNCHNVHELAFNDETDRMYVATYGRGVLQGNLTDLNDDRANLAVDVGCDDTHVIEGGVLNCTVTLSSSGDVSEWRNRLGGPDVDVDLPYRTLRFTVPGFRDPGRDAPWEQANCFTRGRTVEGVSLTARIVCNEALRNFPADGEVDFSLDLRKVFESARENPTDAEITASLNFTEGSPDTDVRDNTATEQLMVYSYPKYADRFDFHFDDFGNLIRNDRIENATGIELDHPSSQHFECPEDPDYPGGDALVRRLERQGENCGGVVVNGSDDAPLSAVGTWSKDVTDLGIGARKDHFAIQVPEADGVSAGASCGTFEVKFAETVNRSLAFRFTLSSSYSRNFTGVPPDGANAKDVPPELEQAFQRNGVDLGPKPFISLADNATDWNSGPWVVKNEWLVIERPDGTLSVYRRFVGPETVSFNKTVAAESWIEINVTGEFNERNPFELNVGKLKPSVYTRSGVRRSDVTSIERNGDTLTVRVDCPRDEGLEELILALGESGQVGGGYELSINFRIKYTRGAARTIEAGIGVDQYDEFDVDFDGSSDWYDRPVDVEELERKIVASEIGLNPDLPPDEPPSRFRASLTGTNGPTGDVPSFGRVLAGEHPYVSVEHDQPYEGRGRLTVSVGDDVLARSGVGPDRVALYRHTDGGWEQLDTERVGETETGQRFRAEFEGLSLFAVGYTEGPLERGRLRLEPADRQVTTGATRSYDLVFDATGGGVGLYDLAVNLSTTENARIVDFENAIGGQDDVVLAPDGSRVDVTVNGGDTPDDGTVALGTVVVEGRRVGSATLGLSVETVGDEDRTSYDVAGGTGATVRVTERITGPDLNGDGVPALDEDGDGLYEDVDGDGDVDVLDVALFLDAFDSRAVQQNPELFNFDGQGGVNILDVAQLLEELP